VAERNDGDSKPLIARCHMCRAHQPYLIRFALPARPLGPYSLQRLLDRIGQVDRCAG
jgi:hypothetical protein